MFIKRGEKSESKIFNKFVTIRRSSDGKWEDKGEPIGFFKFFPRKEGKGVHSNKWMVNVVIGEYLIQFGGFVK